MIAVKIKIIQRYLVKYKDVKKQKKDRIDRGTLLGIIKDVKKEKKIYNGISPEASRNRLQRSSLENHNVAGGKYLQLNNSSQ